MTKYNLSMMNEMKRVLNLQKTDFTPFKATYTPRAGLLEGKFPNRSLKVLFSGDTVTFILEVNGAVQFSTEVNVNDPDEGLMKIMNTQTNKTAGDFLEELLETDKFKGVLMMREEIKNNSNIEAVVEGEVFKYQIKVLNDNYYITSTPKVKDRRGKKFSGLLSDENGISEAIDKMFTTLLENETEDVITTYTNYVSKIL